VKFFRNFSETVSASDWLR